MGTTTLTRYLSEPIGLSAMGVQIDSYRPYFARAKKIVPSKIDKIRELYNTWIEHYHTHYDQYYVKYGTLGGIQGTSGQYRDSEVVTNAPSHDDEIIAGRNSYGLFFQRIKDLTTYFNQYVRTHFHEVTDTWG